MSEVADELEVTAAVESGVTEGKSRTGRRNDGD